jgi:hypothetical protein
MPENCTCMGSSRNGDNGNGPPRLRRWVTRGFPSPLVAASLVAAALGVAACTAPAPSHNQPASGGTASAHPAASMTARPAPSASVTPSASATRGGATAASPTQLSTTSAAARPQPSPANSALPLAPAQLPAFNVESWTAYKASSVEHVHGHNIELNECASVYGPATWQQQSYVSGSGGDSASVDTFTFGTSAEARSAFAAASSGMKSCQATSRALQVTSHITPDAVSRETASTDDAAAFERTWTGVGGVSAYGAQINHLYLATRGTTLVDLGVDEFGKEPAPYDVRDDAAMLATLLGVLTR